MSETEVFVAGRFVGQFNDKWHYKVRADYGSGGTERTVNALADVGYAFGETRFFSLDLAYRYLNIELKADKNGAQTESDITMSGPALGFIFSC